MGVQLIAPQVGHLILFKIPSKISFGEFSVTFESGLYSSINLSARKRSWQCLQSTSGSAKLARCPDAFHTVEFEMIAESNPIALGTFVTNSFHHKALMLFFSKTPSGP
jgi:hypothetical protein